ncbi:MAG: ABC transporter permease [Planctomycetota bacterium]|nr:MAG: ABC transporter permease [Planctomycetota bacterium]REJ91353.1 MAG: ABC transporter permease [Planctomycetota bacterium]
MQSPQPSYRNVFFMFARNSLVRDMMFRGNFLIEAISAPSWTLMNQLFYNLIFIYTDSIGTNTGWGEYQFYVFFATTILVNSLVQAFFMRNFEEFSELIRTGNLDFALLKPIDTQFLISLHRVTWSAFANTLFGLGLLSYSVWQLSGQADSDWFLSPLTLLLYVGYVLCGVAILYSLMLVLSSTSIWLGRNQTLYNFWFYITNFSRYPMEIYGGSPVGTVLRLVFSFAIPILLAVNVPARWMAQPLKAGNWLFALVAIVATVLSLLGSRWVFKRALLSYRSASS